MGVQEPEELARHIWRSRGPSGENREYLFMLEEALEALRVGSGDRHVEDLAGMVRALGVEESKRKGSVGDHNAREEVAGKAVESEMERVTCGEASHEQQETGKS